MMEWYVGVLIAVVLPFSASLAVALFRLLNSKIPMKSRPLDPHEKADLLSEIEFYKGKNKLLEEKVEFTEEHRLKAIHRDETSRKELYEIYRIIADIIKNGGNAETLKSILNRKKD